MLAIYVGKSADVYGLFRSFRALGFGYLSYPSPVELGCDIQDFQP